MKMFSSCSGECCVCGTGNGCLAGHGDDYFYVASKEKIIERLDKGRYPSYKKYMIEFLKKEYNYDYENKGDYLVKVVRCKDCKFYHKEDCAMDDWHFADTKENDFCSYGKLKEDKRNETN